MSESVTAEEALFAEAVVLPKAEQTRLLERSCKDKPALRERLDALLHEHGEASGVLDSQLLVALPEVARVLRDDAPVEDYVGSRIGRYKLLQKIGEGGCGAVFMAEQTEPVHRRVAVKVIKLGMDTREVIARFEAERQALALMEHPNIARVLDAGAAETGRPYFVMELVRGIPITRHCDEHQLGTRERLKLLVQVCSAVQHAHQKGIIHRDLKPSNILVTLHDGEAVPKIIDFGIAKATQGRLTDKTLFTAFEQFVGTPAYMSPEQTERSGLDVDTRSDIYSLGVLLYELLTGRPPFESHELLKDGLDEMRRTIREKEPVKPSTCIATLDAGTCATVARERGVDGPQLRSLLRGDLDWIAMRCLEKKRTRRYETVDGLALDIIRFLRNEPIFARPPGTFYLLGKLVARHRLAFLGGATVFGLLVAGLIFSSWAFRKEHAARERAEVEAARSEQLAQFMKDLLAGVGPQVAMGRDTRLLRAILDETAEQLKRRLNRHPEVEADVRETLGTVYRDLKQYGSAVQMHEAALQIRRRIFNPEHPKIADSLYHLGQVLARQGRQAEAETLLQDSLARREKPFGTTRTAVTDARTELATVRRLMREAAGPQVAAGGPPVDRDVTPGQERVLLREPLPPQPVWPALIRLAHTGGRAAGVPYNAGTLLNVVHRRDALEREFDVEGVRIKWDYFPSGAATDEALAHGAIDFAGQGNIGAIVSRAAGLKHKLLLRIGANGTGTSYLVTRADSPIKSVADLKGKRLGTIKGTSGHLTMCRIIDQNGFAPRDFEIVNFNSAAAIQAALGAGEIEADVRSRPFALETDTKVKVIYELRREPGLPGFSVFWVAEGFEKQHPLIVQRVVNAIVKVAAWSSDARNHDAIVEDGANSGGVRGEIEKTWGAVSLKRRYSPLMDQVFRTTMRQLIDDARRFEIISAEMDLEHWIEPKYLERALEDLKLEGFWAEPSFGR